MEREKIISWIEAIIRCMENREEGCPYERDRIAEIKDEMKNIDAELKTLANDHVSGVMARVAAIAIMAIEEK